MTSSLYDDARAGIQAQIDRYRREPQRLPYEKAIKFIRVCRNTNWILGIECALESPRSETLKQICEMAKDIPWVFESGDGGRHGLTYRWIISPIKVAAAITALVGGLACDKTLPVAPKHRTKLGTRYRS